MRLQFKCKCGTKLNCSFRGIGRILPCPVCLSEIKVPTPSRTVVQQSMKPLPHAMPDCSSIEYAALVVQIEDSARFNFRLCELTSQQELAYSCVDDAIRILRNVVTFLHHQTADPDSIACIGGNSSFSPLSSTAAGTNFAGIGTRKSKVRQNKQWEQQKNDSAKSTPRHPLAEKIIASIQSLRTDLA